MGTLYWGGGVGGGVPAKPGSYIFLDAFVMMQNTLANQPPKSGWKMDICSGSNVFFYVEKVMDFHLKGADIRFCRSLSENDASLIHRSWSNLGVTETKGKSAEGLLLASELVKVH